MICCQGSWQLLPRPPAKASWADATHLMNTCEKRSGRRFLPVHSEAGLMLTETASLWLTDEPSPPGNPNRTLVLLDMRVKIRTAGLLAGNTVYDCGKLPEPHSVEWSDTNPTSKHSPWHLSCLEDRWEVCLSGVPGGQQVDLWLWVSQQDSCV